jgi:hypothetical protein
LVIRDIQKVPGDFSSATTLERIDRGAFLSAISGRIATLRPRSSRTRLRAASRAGFPLKEESFELV